MTGYLPLQKSLISLQVSSVWTVSTSSSQDQYWDADLLKKFGGPTFFSSVWEALKKRKQAGHSKRPATDNDLQPIVSKKSRSGTLVTPVALGSSCVVSSGIETPTMNSNAHLSPHVLMNHVEATPVPRRKKRAGRNKLVATPKITEWLLKCPDIPVTPQELQKTPPVSASGSKKTKRRGRRAAGAKKQETPSDPSFLSKQVLPTASSSFHVPEDACSTPEDPKIGYGVRSNMSPQLRSRLTSQNSAACPLPKAAASKRMRVSKEGCQD